MLLVLLITFLLGKLQSSVQDKVMKTKDERVNLLSEVFTGIRVIKMFVWESRFFKKIQGRPDLVRLIRSRDSRSRTCIVKMECNISRRWLSIL